MPNSSNQEMPFNSFAKLLGAVAKISRQEVNETIFTMYYEQVKRIPMERLIVILSEFLTLARFPSIAEILGRENITIVFEQTETQKVGVNVGTIQEQENTFYGNQDCAGRLEAPHPDCISEHASGKYFRNEVYEWKKAGWNVFDWKEYTALREVDGGQGGLATKQKVRVYFAMALFTRREVSVNEIKVKNTYREDAKLITNLSF